MTNHSRTDGDATARSPLALAPSSTGVGVPSLRVLQHGSDLSVLRIDLPALPRLPYRERVARIAAALADAGTPPDRVGDPNSKIVTLKIPRVDLRVVPHGPHGAPCADAHADAQALFQDATATERAQRAALATAHRALAPSDSGPVPEPYPHALALNADFTGFDFTVEDRHRFVCRSRKRPVPHGADDALTLYVSRRLKVYGKLADIIENPEKGYVRPEWERKGWLPAHRNVWRAELTFDESDFARAGTTDGTWLWRWGLAEDRFVKVPRGRSASDPSRRHFRLHPVWELLWDLEFPFPTGDASLPPSRPRAPYTSRQLSRTAIPSLAAWLAAADVDRQVGEGVRSATPADVLAYVARTRDDFAAMFEAKRRRFEARFGLAGPTPPAAP